MPRVSEERRAALRKFCELAERGQSTLGRVAVGTGDILGVLDDLDATEKRERITAKALEDMLRECRNQGDKHRQAVAAISEPTAAMHSDGRGDAVCGHCGAVIECRHDERFLTGHRLDCPLSEVR